MVTNGNMNGSGKLKKGDILFMQGETPDKLYYMQKGSIEILLAPQDYAGLDKRIILEHSIRVGAISEPVLLGGMPGTARALEDCDIQVFPCNGGIQGLAKTDPAKASNLIAHLLRRIEMSTADLNKIGKLYQNICIVCDNLAILAKEVSAGELPERIESRAEVLHEAFSKGNAQIPKVLDHQFLIVDRSVVLKKKYSIPGEPIESMIDKDLFIFIKRLGNVDRNILAHLFKADSEISLFALLKLSNYLNRILERIVSLYDSLDEEMDLLFGAGESFSQYLAEYGAMKDWERSGRLSPDFAKNICAIAGKIYQVYSDIQGKDISLKFPGLSKLKEYAAKPKTAPQQQVQASVSRPVQSAAPSTNVGRMYENSLSQIFEFALASKDFCNQFLRLLNDFRNMSNPFAPDDDARKLRRQVTRSYWQLYSLVYIRSLKEKQIPPPVKLMILFGFVDEKLVDPDQIEALHQLAGSSGNAQMPILFECEFLQKIYNQEEPPSLNEVGLTYEKQIREENEKAAKGAVIDENDPFKKVDYEIQNRVQSTVGICAGSRSTSFPILTSHLIKGNPEQFFVSKQRVAEVLKEILEIDHSAFYRETVTKLNEPVIFEEEVIPYFVILPCFGTKTMMWQEIVGTNKRTRARIVVPAFFMGDLKRSIAHSIASFRWELNRSLQGAMWADPVEGGLTGAYYDYVQFFRKNPRLSTEAKEKLHERIKGVRNNMKELFCEDYIMWILFEREGTMKLNGVVRDIFYRFIPFKKEIRDHLETMPAFVELSSKFKNVRMRKIREYENKFRKYRDASGGLPPALQQFMDFLKM